MKEILTLQLGHYSNFIGTHLWNIQERTFDYSSTSPSEINHDVLYREGLNHKNQVTFTPRMLLVDLKGSLKGLPERGTLYDTCLDPLESYENWPKSLIDVRQGEGVPKTEFVTNLESGSLSENAVADYNLDEKVKVWSDFLYARFHPRSVNIVNKFELNNENTPFDVFTLGTSVWKTEQFEDSFGDKARQYIEECDNFHGFHVILDATNAFSGLSSACIQYLTDEYERKSVLAIPVIPSHYSDYELTTDEEKQQSIIKDSIRILNLALCFDSLASHSSLVVPLSTRSEGWRQPGPTREFNHVSYKHQLPYHSTAILASAIDTFTLKHRVKNEEFSLNDLCSDLNSRNRTIAAASVCLPFSLNSDADLIDCLDNWEGPLSQCITPNCSIGTDRVMQHITLRGIDETRLKRPAAQARKQRDMPAYKCKTMEEMLRFYLSCTTYGSASNVTIVNKPQPVHLPFPNIFDSNVSATGNILATERSGVVDTVPVLSGLHCGAGVGDMIESLHTESKKIKISRFHQFSDLESDEFKECLDRIFELRECYEDNYFL